MQFGDAAQFVILAHHERWSTMRRQLPTSVALIRHGPQHLEATCRWLTIDSGLREQIDSLAAPTSEQENEAYWHSKWADKSREDYAIVVDNARHVGNCGLSDIDLKRLKAQLWIYVAEDRGKGAGKSAVRRLLARAFNGLNLERVYLRVLATNPQACAFYRKQGFVEEGRARHDTRLDGKFVDAYLFSMLASEFSTLDGNLSL
jgi:RimJ/RimL family protein N-acetyltransferase